MSDTKNYKNAIDKLTKVINTFIEIYRLPYQFAIKELLYPSEIHTIAAIGEHEGLNVTDLSDEMGVSKAAISQLVNKLEKKGLVKRYKNDGNNKETLLRLTMKSKIAFAAHKEYHENRDKEIINIMKKMSKKEFAFFNTIIEEINVYSKQLLKDRK